jgi:glycosyltransferase involved in cell wall biosynthesis
MNYVIGIDASRCRSGGAYAHLIGILSNLNPEKYGIRKIYLWSHSGLLRFIPDYPWLVKRNPSYLEGSILKQLFWQRFLLNKELRSYSCDLLFTLDASSLCLFRNQVVLSQDMLSYEKGIMEAFGYSKDRLRLLIILVLQNMAFRRAHGVIFLTNYASKVIQGSCGRLLNVKVIPHGIGDEFRGIRFVNQRIEALTVKCLYVSNTAMYKYQWHVVKAIELLRSEGLNVELDLVGGGAGKARRKLDRQLKFSDPKSEYVRQFPFVPNRELTKFYRQADIFIFASGCENMPVTLLEGMSSGLPIVCSNRGPMPEVLEDGGLYFNPEDPLDIARSIKKIILDTELSIEISKKSERISKKYTWKRCSEETFSFLINNIQRKIL